MLDSLVLSSVQVVESITETCKVMASLSYRDNASSSYRVHPIEKSRSHLSFSRKRGFFIN